MNIGFTCKIKRDVVLDPNMTQGKMMKVGDIEQYEKTDTHIKVNIRLLDDLDPKLEEAIQKNPGCLKLLETVSAPEDVLFIPSRPKLVLP